MIYRLGELFCGPGGLAHGALDTEFDHAGERFAVAHAWATDYDRDTCETYARNICDGNDRTVLCADIRNLDLDVLGSISDVDAMAFGFPCNDFSVVGEQRGIDGKFGPLFQYCVDAVARFRPQWFLAENVGGLRNSNEGKALRLILSKFHAEGYSLYPHLYSFDRYGVPQARQRLIIIGIRSDVDAVFSVPSPEPYASIDNTCGTALSVPPIPSDAPNHELTRQSPQVIRRLRCIKPGENAFTAEMPSSLQLNVVGAKISQIYKRLDPSKPAYTVTGSGGGGTHMYHWEEPRALTNRERARLQTFPDSFVFCGSKESVRKQIGMAVPCRGARVIVDAVLKSLAGVCYPSINPGIAPMLCPNHVERYNAVGEEKELLLFERSSGYGGR